MILSKGCRDFISVVLLDHRGTCPNGIWRLAFQTTFQNITCWCQYLKKKKKNPARNHIKGVTLWYQMATCCKSAEEMMSVLQLDFEGVTINLKPEADASSTEGRSVATSSRVSVGCALFSLMLAGEPHCQKDLYWYEYQWEGSSSTGDAKLCLKHFNIYTDLSEVRVSITPNPAARRVAI